MALLATARIAILLKLYQQGHGRYPDALEQLAATGQKLPLDPYVGKPFHYRPQGDGFMVWSVGTDGVDNHGVELDPTNRWVMWFGDSARYRGKQGDLTFRVTR